MGAIVGLTLMPLFNPRPRVSGEPHNSSRRTEELICIQQAGREDGGVHGFVTKCDALVKI